MIPMIAFIEGGMRIPMGIVTGDYLRAHRLAPTQYVPNVFRILGCVDALNEKMGLGLTHHDVNWVYNLHHLKGQGYYLKSRYPEVKLIQCLRDSNKGLNKDFLIVSGNGTIAFTVPGFLLPKGVPVPKGTLSTQPILESDLVTQSIPEGIPRVVFPSHHTTSASASSQPTNKEESEGE